jgi:transposase-like protein
MAATLNQPQFQDADKAREYLEALRWANGVVCPHCGSLGAHKKLEGSANYRPGLFKCADCREQFTVTVGTVFERSKVGLHIWLQAVHLMSASKKGISAKQLERMLGVTYKTAWFMSHRIREAMKAETNSMLGGPGSSGVVEADETYWGHITDEDGNKKDLKTGYGHKMKIVSLVERDGHKRTYHVANVTADTARYVLKNNIHQSAHLMTDEAKIYNKAGKQFAIHSTVNHSAKEYARGSVTTNTVESSFAILKRGLTGTFHSVSEKHLQRYCTEFDFRWNFRQSQGFTDTARADIVLSQIGGKRLTYQRSDRQQEALV